MIHCVIFWSTSKRSCVFQLPVADIHSQQNPILSVNQSKNRHTDMMPVALWEGYAPIRPGFYSFEDIFGTTNRCQNATLTFCN